MADDVVVVTGAAGRLGKLLVAGFLARGDSVVAVGRSADRLAIVESELQPAKGKWFQVVADLSSPGGIKCVTELLAKSEINPTCLVNAARDLEHLALEADGSVSRERFLGELLIDVVVPYELSIALATGFGGSLRRIVNIGSQYGLVAANPRLYDHPQSQSPLQYSVAKAAVHHLTKELAVRLAPRGITVNCVVFGGVEGRVDHEFRKRYAAMVPIGRMLADSEVFPPVGLLASPGASGITGHLLVVDGGWSAW